VRSPALAVLEAVAQRRPASPRRRTNVGGAERAATLLAGAALLAWLFRRPSVASAVAAAVGGALVYRGARGRSRLYEAVGVSTARPGRVERAMTINRPPRDLHAAWRDPAVRARVMLGADDVEIVTDAAEEMVAWRASGRGGAGHIAFRAAGGGRGTEVRLALDGVRAAEADEILRRFKQLMEAGEIPTTAGQPTGRAR
jgi:uncharacterized membrane protein